MMDEMNPQVRNYLLRWRRATSLIALICVLMTWISVQIQSVQLLQSDGDVLFTGVAMGLMYFTTTVSQAVFPLVAKKTPRLVAMLILPLLCIVCALSVLMRSPEMLLGWLAAFGFVYGLASAFLLQDYLAATRACTEEKRKIFLLTPAVGIALFFAGTITFWLMKSIADASAAVYFSTFCAVCAAGVCLKSINEIQLPEEKENAELYMPLQQRSQHDRIELGLLFLTFAVSGAVMVFFPSIGQERIAFSPYPTLLLIFGAIPLQFTEQRMLRLLLVGSLLMICFGIVSLWNMLYPIGMWGICLGLLLVLHYAEEQILSKKAPAQAGVLLAEISAAMIAGIILSAISLAIS